MSRSHNSHPKSPEILHGPKTRNALILQLHAQSAKRARRLAGPREVTDAEIAHVHDREISGEMRTGKHRLVESRAQHDVADHASEKNRLWADAKRHKHGNPHGQLNGGPTRH